MCRQDLDLAVCHLMTSWYQELDEFLEVFYSADSIFKGDSRLPEKKRLKEKVLANWHADQDALTFEVSCS